LIQLASQYLAKHHLTDRACRFDVVLLQGTDTSAPQIEHIQNAFYVSRGDLRW
jgi:putative endonuclease